MIGWLHILRYERGDDKRALYNIRKRSDFTNSLSDFFCFCDIWLFTFIQKKNIITYEQMFIYKNEVKMMKESIECEIVEVHPQIVDRLQKDMKNQEQYQELSNLFKMFADATRCKILSLLFHEELCVCDIAAILKMKIGRASCRERVSVKV